MITIKDLNKSYGRVQALNNIQLEFKPKGITALLGPNGSGKSTLIKSIMGLVIPDSGDILVGGYSILNQYHYRSQIAYLPQVTQFPDYLSAKSMIQLIEKLNPLPSRAEELISLFDLKSEMDKKLHHLSGGNKQKVNIVLALLHDLPIVILDEPSNGLDPFSLNKFKEYILNEKEKGKQILLTTHIMSLADELSDEVVFLLDGKVYFSGSLEEIKKSTGQNNLENSIASILGKHQVSAV